MARQFENVSCTYGAPMGRRDAADLDTSPRSVRLFAVNLDTGGYDDGGAYWGLGSPGERLYCARDKDGSEKFTRATSRAMAAMLMGVPAPALVAPFDWRAWCDRHIVASDAESDDVIAYREACEMVESEAKPTRVVFRVWNHKPDKGFDGQVIALFPDIVENYSGEISSYEHVGQHGSADYSHFMQCTRPATAEESAPLRRELESAPYHYNLREVKRR